MEAQVIYTIRASDRIADLKGEGEELLLDRITGTILARFVDGNFATTTPQSLNRAGDRLKDEPTLLLTKVA
jgi:hypothetical protein